MNKKLIYLVFFILIVGVTFTSPASAELMGWWKLDDGAGTIAVDSSGNGRDGTLEGDPQWVSGMMDGALEFDGDDSVDTGYSENLPVWTIAAWVMSPFAPSDDPPSGPIHREQNYQINWNHSDVNWQGTVGVNAGGWYNASLELLEANTWYHLAGTYDGNELKSYKDGVLITTNGDMSGDPADEPSNLALARHSLNVTQFFTGTVDDARVYNEALTLTQIRGIMRPDPDIAWVPQPGNNATVVEVEEPLQLNWIPGEKAVQHHVYLGVDEAAVEDADISDITGIYRGLQDANSYDIPEALEYGQFYYWRIDEVNDAEPNSPWKGNVWSFMAANYLVIEEFEDYNDYAPDRIFDTWIDGWNTTANGATAGYPNPDFTADEHFIETIIVHEGDQSMPYFYDNDMKYSEAERPLADEDRDWTRAGVQELSIWFRGYMDYVGSFTEDPAGTYTMTATGADIWNDSDEFHFAYRELNGPGSITVKVESVEETDGWAKAGVMLRDTLDADSVHGMMIVSAAAGVSFQRRSSPGGSSLDTTVEDVNAPQWVRIERNISGAVTASYSADGSTWIQVETERLNINIPMYIGLVVTAHNADEVCEAVFSNVSFAGTVSDQWTDQDIGILNNSPQPMYVAVANAAGEPAVVYHEDPSASITHAWTEWVVPLQDIADQGIELTDVDNIAIGVGTRGDTTTLGGSGKLYIDDIRLYLSRPPEPVDPGTDGLVASYALDGDVLDGSGDGLDATAMGEPNFVEGVNGMALALDGIDDYVELPIGSAIAGMTECTIVTWVNWSGQGGAWQRIFDFGSSTTINMFLTPQNGYTNTPRFAMTISGWQDEDQINTEEVLPTGWHHVAVTIDPGNTTHSLYIDGTVVGRNTAARYTPSSLGETTQNWLGRAQYPDPYFNGYLDDFIIYNRVLTEVELLFLANN